VSGSSGDLGGPPIAFVSMALDDQAKRATSFGTIAQDYDRYRPGPPAEAVEWILPRECDAVVDIGAGTGALTRLLVDRARRVTAVEPDPRMAEVLAARVPRATVLSGSAEQLPLPDGECDAVVGSSMWHWVDQARASMEAARVLRPGGVLGLLWSGPNRSEGWLADVFSHSRSEALRPRADEYRRRRLQVTLPPDAPFGEPETHLVGWTITVTPDELIGLAGTYSAALVLPEAERAQQHAELEAVVRTHPAVVGRDELEIPMRCFCWRAVRLT
jgi:SAM-dependent methyltransferase